MYHDFKDYWDNNPQMGLSGVLDAYIQWKGFTTLINEHAEETFKFRLRMDKTITKEESRKRDVAEMKIGILERNKIQERFSGDDLYWYNEYFNKLNGIKKGTTWKANIEREEFLKSLRVENKPAPSPPKPTTASTSKLTPIPPQNKILELFNIKQKLSPLHWWNTYENPIVQVQDLHEMMCQQTYGGMMDTKQGNFYQFKREMRLAKMELSCLAQFTSRKFKLQNIYFTNGLFLYLQSLPDFNWEDFQHYNKMTANGIELTLKMKLHNPTSKKRFEQLPGTRLKMYNLFSGEKVDKHSLAATCNRIYIEHYIQQVLHVFAVNIQETCFKSSFDSDTDMIYHHLYANYQGARKSLEKFKFTL